jgi:hypothetical protein
MTVHPRGIVLYPPNQPIGFPSRFQNRPRLSLIPARDAFTRPIDYPEFSFWHGISDHLDFETCREVQDDDLFRVDEQGVGIEEEGVAGFLRQLNCVLLFL